MFATYPSMVPSHAQRCAGATLILWFRRQWTRAAFLLLSGVAALLKNPKVLKVGRDVERDLEKLCTQYPLLGLPQGFVNFLGVAGKFGGYERPGLAGLAEALLGVEVPTSPSCPCANVPMTQGTG